jgi:CheY-like chemotaxis protein
MTSRPEKLWQSTLRLRGVVCSFANHEELLQLLQESDGKELPLPHADCYREGEWLVVSVAVEGECTTVPGRVEDPQRGRVCFEGRDWTRLVAFANGDGPPSVPPDAPRSIVDEVKAAPGTRVLVVSRDPELRKILRAMLESSGIGTLEAAEPEAAFAILGAEPADLVLLDSALSPLVQRTLCRKMREDARLAQVPLMLLSGHSVCGDVTAPSPVPVDDFVNKPFRAVELRARVHGLLARARRLSVTPSTESPLPL